MAEPRRERKVVTVVFCDLVGFTARAESMDPEDVEALLRPYHERVRAKGRCKCRASKSNANFGRTRSSGFGAAGPAVRTVVRDLRF
jgi:hypothetical protein